MVEVPAVVEWSNGTKPGGTPFGQCTHTCDHKRVKVVGTSRDPLRRSLVQCVDSGCTVNPSIVCRAWFTEKMTPWTKYLAVWIGVPR